MQNLTVPNLNKSSAISTPAEDQSQEKMNESFAIKMAKMQEMDKLREENSKLALKQKCPWYLTSIDCSPPDVNIILQSCIDKIWTQYDEDNSGYLDREEAKKFVTESISGKKTTQELEKMTEEEIEKE